MVKMKNVLFAIPNTMWFGQRYWHLFPYTIGLLTAVLKDKYNMSILDANIENLNFDEVKERINQFEPDFFCISCIEYDKSYQKIASIAKSACPNTKVIVGGVYPTLLPEVILKDKNIDYAALGEGEYRLPQLLEQLGNNNISSIEHIDGLAYRSGNKIAIQEVKNYIERLDSLKLPCYDYLDFFAYANKADKFSYSTYPRRFPYAYTITSRGCPFNCIFCSVKTINGRNIRYRSADSVLKEIDLLVEEYGIKEIMFLDDNFYLDRKRVKKILLGIIDRKYDLTWKTLNVAVYALDDEIIELMKESGCYQISLSIESGTKEGLRLLRKPLKTLSTVKQVVKKARTLNFEIGAMFVIGTPGETWDQIRQTFRFAEELDLDYCSFNIATPLPKTELYEIAKERNLLPPDFNFSNNHFSGFGTAYITTNEFTPEELLILRAFEWDRINFKNEGKIAKVASMTGLTLQELNDWRVSTRREIFQTIRGSNHGN